MSGPVSNHIYTGDCLEVMRSWPDDCVDHCIADPPFGIASGRGRRSKSGLGWAFSSHVTMQETWDQFTEDEYFRFSLDWLREVCRVVKPNGNLLVFGTFHSIYLLGFLLSHVLERRILNSIVWFKPNAQPNITARTLTESTEQIIWAVNETPKRAKKWTFNYWDAKRMNGGKQMRNLWEFPVTPRRERINGAHPSQKPLALVERAVLLASTPGELLIDPFGGAGTLAVAAAQQGRRWVLIEIAPEYAEAARQRVESISGDPPPPAPTDGQSSRRSETKR
jgi:site-specific DNA-methyltransferase (adenine-specific)